MAAIMGRTEVGVREFGQTVTIPNNPVARLMYYLDCICTVLDMSDTANLYRLRSFGQYHLLTEAEIDALLALCLLLSPDELNGKVIFQDDSMCGTSNNAFFEIRAVQHRLLLSESIIIGGQNHAVSNVMAYKQQWLVTNWVEPMKHFTSRLVRIATGGSAPPSQPRAIEYPRPRTPSSPCCTIL